MTGLRVLTDKDVGVSWMLDFEEQAFGSRARFAACALGGERFRAVRGWGLVFQCFGARAAQNLLANPHQKPGNTSRKKHLYINA